MSDMPNTPKKAPPRKSNKEDPSRGRLLRSPDERMLAGVAGGAASYLGVDPTFVRLGFAVAALFGGFGILAYLVMAVIVPMDDGTGNPVPGRPPTWAIVLLALAALIILPGPFIGVGDGWFFGIGFLWLIALVLAGALAYRAVRGDRPLFGSRGGSPAAGSEATTEVREPGDGTAPG